MKQLFFISVTLFCLQFTVTAQDYDNAVEYLNAISRQRENISKKFMAYVSASAHGKREKKVEALRAKLLDEVEDFERSETSLLNDKTQRLKELENMSKFSSSSNNILIK